MFIYGRTQKIENISFSLYPSWATLIALLTWDKYKPARLPLEGPYIIIIIIRLAEAVLWRCEGGSLGSHFIVSLPEGAGRRGGRTGALVSHLSAYLHSHLAHFVFIQEVLREALPSHKKELPKNLTSKKSFRQIKTSSIQQLKIIIMTIMTTRAIDLPFTRVRCTFWDHISDQFNKFFWCKWSLLKIWVACSFVWEL